MKILGIDPGLAILGWGVLEVDAGQPKRLHYGCIETPSGTALTSRLLQIYQQLHKVVEVHQPSVMALETLFFVKNAKTLAQVGHVRGIALLVAGEENLQVFEYAPRQIKMAITGYGGAEKRQMQLVLQTRLNLPTIPQPDDAADALAVALCHLQYAQTYGKSAVTV